VTLAVAQRFVRRGLRTHFIFAIAPLSHWHARYLFDRGVIDRILLVPTMKPKRTILCVDSNEPALSVHKIMLETRGYRVLAFTRPDEALARFRTGGVDLVMSNVAMPGMDGQSLVAAVKQMSPHTPAILLSDRSGRYDTEGVADVFLSRGMFAPADLLERVRILLVRKRGPRRMVRTLPAPMPPPSQFGTA